MDKAVILAVAGSGKTSHIVESLNTDARALVLTYTDNNVRNLRAKIIRKFGFFPATISLSSYFAFLYSFCFQPFLWDEFRPTGFSWKRPPEWTLRLPRNNPSFYFDHKRRVYHNRLAKLLETEGVLDLVIQRLEKYYDHLFIDEVQDFGGHDFNFLTSLVSARLGLTFVGDFYQHTFDTSRDGNVNSGLHDDFGVYVRRLRKAGLRVDQERLGRSYRCSPSVCDYVSQQIGIPIRSHRDDPTPVSFIHTKEEARRLLVSDRTMTLFYDEHYRYPLRSQNWGASKGDDYDDVCVVLNKTTQNQLVAGKGTELRPQTRNRLYVACTRAQNGLYFIGEGLMRECIGTA